jgi:hypothetical protein
MSAVEQALPAENLGVELRVRHDFYRRLQAIDVCLAQHHGNGTTVTGDRDTLVAAFDVADEPAEFRFGLSEGHCLHGAFKWSYS